MTMPSVGAVAAYWAGRKLPGTDYMPCIDRGEPNCFGCGAWGRYDADQWGREHTWERGITLDRAHVVAQSLSGGDEPSNIVLLCHDCHVASPDTAEPRHMWRWLASHPRTGCQLELLLGPNFREKLKTYTGPGREIITALASFSEAEARTLSQIAQRPGLVPGLEFTVHWRTGGGRNDGVSAATWEAVLGDLLCREQGALFLEREAS